MSQYKLIYFDLRGRAEVIRFLFVVAGKKYEDFRIVRSEWDEMRPKVPTMFAQVPLLEVDGTVLSQSHTIEMFLAKRFGLCGKNEMEETRCNMILNAIEDLIKPTIAYRYETDEQKKKDLKAKSIKAVNATLEQFSKVLESSECKSGYFVGDGLTVADLAVYHYPSLPETFLEFKADWSKWPNLQTLRQKVESNEKIKAWLQNRPDNWI